MNALGRFLSWLPRRPAVQPESAWAGPGKGPDQPRPRLKDCLLDAHLEEHGYAVAREVLGAAEMARLARLFEEHDTDVHRRPFGVSLHSSDAGMRQAVDRGIRAVLAPKVAQLTNGYRCCFGNFLVKAPVGSAEGGVVKLHQDVSLVNEAQFQSLAFWIPLSDTDEGNGCLRVVPGSHHFSQALRWPGAPFAFDRDEDRLLAASVALPVRAGDCAIFSAKLVHWSEPNRSGRIRVVAGGAGVPRAAQLIYLHQDASKPHLLEIYSVSDDFYATHAYQTRPEPAEGAELIAHVRARQAPLGEKDWTGAPNRQRSSASLQLNAPGPTT